MMASTVVLPKSAISIELFVQSHFNGKRVTLVDIILLYPIYSGPYLRVYTAHDAAFISVENS